MPAGCDTGGYFHFGNPKPCEFTDPMIAASAHFCQRAEHDRDDIRINAHPTRPWPW